MATKAVGGLIAVALAAALAPAFGSGGESNAFTFKPKTGNVASLQRGARDFMAYCSGCHSLKYLRYNRLGKDLGLTEDQLKANLMFTSEKPGEHIFSSMPKSSGDPAKPSPSEVWFGRAPPDLSLSARERGADWVYSYLLTFYLDPSKASGTNNLTLPGASMPHVLGDLQGWQVLKAEDHEGEHAAEGHGGPKLELVQPGKLSPAQYKEMAGDLTNFLVYAAEPGRNHRMAVGGFVLLFTVVFGVFWYLLKTEYWKDVH